MNVIKRERLVDGNCETLNEFLFFFFFVRVLTLLFYDIFIGEKVKLRIKK